MHHKTFKSNINFADQGKDADTFIDLDRLWAAVMRRANVIAACVVASMVLAGLYLVLATPVYTAMTQVLLDESLSRYAEEESHVPVAQIVVNRIAIAGEILKSKEMALTVVDKAKFDENDTIVNPPMSPAELVKSSVRGLVNLLTPGEPRVSEAARRAGINVKFIYMSAFMTCSVLAAAGGILAAARLASSSQQAGTGDVNLNAIAAAVIGGTSLFGGRGSAWSALLGIIVIQSIASGLTLLDLSSSLRYMITGAVLAIAVIVDSLARRSRQSHGRA